MLHIPGFFNIWQSVKHVAGMQVPGGFVECGCCLGGSSIFLVLARDAFALEDRRIDVFDTFAGFPRDSIYSLARPSKRGLSLASYYDTVRENFERTCGTANVVLHQGDVADTLVGFDRATALVRLDTDFYSSTRIELRQLYPTLSAHGVLIVDDYGVIEGAREATDEYFAALNPRPRLFRVDRGTHSGVKPTN